MRTAKRVGLVVTGVCVAVAAATLAQAGPFGTPYSGPHACALLTTALAQSVIGKDARRTRSAAPNKWETDCQYTSSTGFVTVKAGSWGWLKPMGKTAAVSGLGDEAWIGPMGLVVRKGERAISVLVAITGTYAGQAAAQIETRQHNLEKGLAPKLLASL